MKPLGCGCALVEIISAIEDVFPEYCPEAKKLMAEICQAVREKDWDGMRLLGERLKRHLEERPELGDNRVAALTKAGASK